MMRLRFSSIGLYRLSLVSGLAERDRSPTNRRATQKDGSAGAFAPRGPCPARVREPSALPRRSANRSARSGRLPATGARRATDRAAEGQEAMRQPARAEDGTGDPSHTVSCIGAAELLVGRLERGGKVGQQAVERPAQRVFPRDENIVIARQAIKGKEPGSGGPQPALGAVALH